MRRPFFWFAVLPLSLIAVTGVQIAWWGLTFTYSPCPEDQGPLQPAYDQLGIYGEQLLGTVRASNVLQQVWWALPMWVVVLGFYALGRLRSRRDGLPHCTACGHVLKGLTAPRCPECGEAI